jgi:hypothetical protein
MLTYLKNHIVHFLHHAPYCIIMCTMYHIADEYFGFTEYIVALLKS